jgi:Domain of unknown function (DUF4189)
MHNLGSIGATRRGTSGPWAYFTSTLDVAGALRRIRMGPGRYGVSWNQPTPARAQEVALGECGVSGCGVVTRIGPAMCGALATTADGKHAGAAWRKDREAARLAALKSCDKDQAGECLVRATDCNK